MKNRKLWVAILAGVMAAVMLLTLLGGLLASTVSAASSSAQIKEEIKQLQSQKAEIQAQISELEGQIDENMSQMEQIVAQKNVIDQQVFLLYEQIDNANAQITAYNQLIADKQAELDAAQARLAELNEKNKDRIRAMEEGGELSYWSVIFKANSFSDLLDRLVMIEEIAAADNRRLDEMRQAAEVVAAAKEDLEAEVAAQAQSKAELEAAQLELENKRAEADKLLKDLVAQGDVYMQDLYKAEEVGNAIQQQIYNKTIEQQEAEQREYEAWLAAQVGKAGDKRVVNGITWLTPVNFAYVSGGYGPRIPPIAGASSFHQGIDLAASYGEPILASRSGRVKYATYDSSSGYYVAVDHMDGYMTKYLHMSRFIVSPGEYVEAGQVIGYVGATGVATGPHLHFSVYLNGQTVNPANYINV